MSEPPENAELIPLDDDFAAEDGALASEPALPEQQYCIFRAGRERFCLHVLEVDEVVEWPRLTLIVEL